MTNQQKLEKLKTAVKRAFAPGASPQQKSGLVRMLKNEKYAPVLEDLENYVLDVCRTHGTEEQRFIAGYDQFKDLLQAHQVKAAA